MNFWFEHRIMAKQNGHLFELIIVLHVDGADVLWINLDFTQLWIVVVILFHQISALTWQISTPRALPPFVSRATCATTLPTPEPTSTNTSLLVSAHASITVVVPSGSSSPTLNSNLPLDWRTSALSTELNTSLTATYESCVESGGVGNGKSKFFTRLRSFFMHTGGIDDAVKGDFGTQLNAKDGVEACSSLSGNKATNETSGFFFEALLLGTSCCVFLNVSCCVGILAKYHRGNLISSFPNRFFKQAKRSFSWLGCLHDFICFAILVHEIRFCPCLPWNTSCTRVRSSISEKSAISKVYPALV